MHFPWSHPSLLVLTIICLPFCRSPEPGGRALLKHPTRTEGSKVSLHTLLSTVLWSVVPIRSKIWNFLHAYWPLSKVYFIFNYVYMYVSVPDMRMCECRCPLRPEEGIRSPRAEVRGSFSCLTWVLGPGSLQEEPMLSTTESHRTPIKCIFISCLEKCISRYCASIFSYFIYIVELWWF